MFVPLNVVYPVFLQPYVTGIFLLPLGLAAFASEVFVLQRYNPAASLSRVLLAVGLANLSSSALGVVLAFILPSEITWVDTPTGVRVAEPGPNFALFSALSFPLLCALSILVEFTILNLLRGWLGDSQLLRAVVIANLASYSILAAGAWLL